MSVLDRFLRYVTIDTRADEASTSVPSTPGQLVLLDLLARELRELGLKDVERDANGYLFATIESTVARACPTIGFIAHVDTSPEMSGAGVKPIVHSQWDGHDIVLPDDPSAVLRPSEWPELAAQVGHDIVTASGTTLLGGDDKAGVAAIVAAAEHLIANPSIPHGPIRIGFTPDEEIGGAPTTSMSRGSALCAPTRSTAARWTTGNGELFGRRDGRVVRGVQHAPRLRQGTNDQRDQGRLALHRSAAARPPVAGNDGPIRRVRSSLSNGGIRRSHERARADQGLRHGQAG